MKDGRDRDDEIKHEGPNGDDRKGPFLQIPSTRAGAAPFSRMVKYFDLRLTHY